MHRTALYPVLAAFLAAVSAPLSPARSAETFLVALNHAPPYRIIARNQTVTLFTGLYVDLVAELAERGEFNLEFKEVPFRRALKLMENGQADIMIGPNRTAEREAYMCTISMFR